MAFPDTSLVGRTDSPSDNIDPEQAAAFKIIDQIIEKKTNNSTDWNFFFGVTNALVVAWAIGACPQHMWLLYIVDALVVFPLRIREVVQPKDMPLVGGKSQPLIRFFYLFEFCYYANFAGVIVVVLLAFDIMNVEVAIGLFGAAFGIGCGTLLCATFLFRNKILFHDVSNSASVLIHLLPSMVMYSLRWKYAAVKEPWGFMFHRGPFDSIPLLDIYKYSSLFYMSWFVPYNIWLLTHGRTLPTRADFDTCLRLNPNGMGEKLICTVFRKSKAELDRKREQHDFTRSEIFVYNCGHAVLALAMVSLSLACYTSKLFHEIVLALVSINAIYLGSGVYAKHIAFMEQYKYVRRKIGV